MRKAALPAAAPSLAGPPRSKFFELDLPVPIRVDGREGGVHLDIAEPHAQIVASVARPNPARTLATRPVRIGSVRSTPTCFGSLMPK